MNASMCATQTSAIRATKSVTVLVSSLQLVPTIHLEKVLVLPFFSPWIVFSFSAPSYKRDVQCELFCVRFISKLVWLQFTLNSVPLS